MEISATPLSLTADRNNLLQKGTGIQAARHCLEDHRLLGLPAENGLCGVVRAE